MNGTVPVGPDNPPTRPSVIRLQGSYLPWSHAAPLSGRAIVSARGSAWMEERLLAGTELADRISERANSASPGSRLEDLLGLCRELNGAWAFCVQWPDGEALAAVDRLRSMPLFYGRLDDGRFALGDVAASLADCKGAGTLDGEAIVEFLLSGYVMDSRTLHEGVSQVQPGEVLYWSAGAVSLHRYYRFLRTEVSSEGPQSLAETLHATMDEVFDRLVRQFAGRRIIVPLSGGLDSRLVVAMLKRHGHRDLVAMNYGRRGSREAEVSRGVADALEIPWEFIPYEDGDWQPLVATPAMREFWHYAGQAAALPHLQDYLALHRLRERDPNLEAVFFPGYVGDMIAGAWTPGPGLFRNYSTRQPRHVSIDRPVDVPAVCNWLLVSKYDLWPARRDEIGRIERRMRSFFEAVTFTAAHNSAAAFDLFEFENRQARYLANAVRSVEFHGFAWWLPLCDSRLMDFFLTVPTELRNTKRLYAWWMRSHIFVGRFSRLADIPPIGDGYVAWYGEAPPNRRTALRQWAQALYPLIKGVEPRRLRDIRFRRALRSYRPPDLRFEEWFATDDAQARSVKLRAVLDSSDSPLSGLPRGVTARIRAREDYPLCFISPLALLAAAYLAEVSRSSGSDNGNLGPVIPATVPIPSGGRQPATLSPGSRQVPAPRVTRPGAPSDKPDRVS